MDTPSPSADGTIQVSGHRTPVGDAFDILRLEPTFDLDGKLLAERHRALSLTLHPDRHAGRPSAERRATLEQAMQVNSAYKTLKDPISRAELLARRRGIPLTDAPVLGPEFLERAMERREALSAAVLAADLPRIRALAQDGRAEQTKQLSRLSELFARPDPVGLEPVLAEVLSSLRFLRRFVDAADAELEAGET